MVKSGRGGVPDWYRAGRGTCLVMGGAGYLIGEGQGGAGYFIDTRQGNIVLCNEATKKYHSCSVLYEKKNFFNGKVRLLFSPTLSLFHPRSLYN